MHDGCGLIGTESFTFRAAFEGEQLTYIAKKSLRQGTCIYDDSGRLVCRLRCVLPTLWARMRYVALCGNSIPETYECLSPEGHVQFCVTFHKAVGKCRPSEFSVSFPFSGERLEPMEPQWNWEKQSFVLNFGGLATFAASSNCVLCLVEPFSSDAHGASEPASINSARFVLGKHSLGPDEVACKVYFRQPFCCAHAFALALAKFSHHGFED